MGPHLPPPGRLARPQPRRRDPHPSPLKFSPVPSPPSPLFPLSPPVGFYGLGFNAPRSLAFPLPRALSPPFLYLIPFALPLPPFRRSAVPRLSFAVLPLPPPPPTLFPRRSRNPLGPSPPGAKNPTSPLPSPGPRARHPPLKRAVFLPRGRFSPVVRGEKPPSFLPSLSVASARETHPAAPPRGRGPNGPAKSPVGPAPFWVGAPGPPPPARRRGPWTRRGPPFPRTDGAPRGLKLF